MVVVICALLFVFSVIKIRENLYRLNSPKFVNIARGKILLANALVLASTLILLIELWRGLDSPNLRFFIKLGTLICFLGSATALVGADKILFKKNKQIMAISFESQSHQYSEQERYAEAKKSIKAACEMDPEELKYWLLYALLEKDANKAGKYIQIAEQMMIQKKLKSKALFSLIEYCKGIRVLNEHGSIDIALEYLNKSQEFHYDKKREKLIQEIENAKHRGEAVLLKF